MIIGLDEVGRGPLAGPVVAAATHLDWQIFPSDPKIVKKIRDSKTLTAKARTEMAKLIREYCPYGIGEASHKEIDALGIRPATRLAMIRALENLLKNFPATVIDLLQIDGNDKFSFPYTSEDIIGGDTKIHHISAASIIAKVYRDNLMIKLAKKYPQYQFEKHKGYGTAAHLASIQKHGPCHIHRTTFEPIKSL